MSLRDDMDMYYSGTYIGFNRNGSVVPFYISYVEWTTDEFETNESEEIYDEDLDSWVPNPDFDPGYGYSEPAYEALRFVGNIATDRDNIEEFSFEGFTNPDAVWDNPELGYIMVNGRLTWLTLRPQRSVKKGICDRRLNNRRVNSSIAWNIWNAEGNGRISQDLAVQNMRNGSGRLDYKGVTIGDFDGTAYSIEPEAAYLRNLIIEKTGATVNIKED